MSYTTDSAGFLTVQSEWRENDYKTTAPDVEEYPHFNLDKLENFLNEEEKVFSGAPFDIRQMIAVVCSFLIYFPLSIFLVSGHRKKTKNMAVLNKRIVA
jgi:hypothetical protein